MFNIGFGELIIILLIAVIVVGPERLPELAQKLGRTINDLRRMYENMRAELGPDFDEVEKQIRTLRSMDPRRELNALGQRVITGLTDEVPELNELRGQTLDQHIAKLQAELRDAARLKELANQENEPVSMAPSETVVHDAEPLTQESVGRIGHELLSDAALDEPLHTPTPSIDHSNSFES